ncbi:MAG: 5-aminolevulinate synthase [Rickettsiaceae bacterium]|nr:5-aminolevulinate synthase [Rickettsiaceae bacterium]
MVDYQSIFDSHISQIHREGRYREFACVIREAGNFPFATHIPTSSKVVMWCINDYLGMSRHEAVLSAAIEAIKHSGTGSGGTRNIGGNNGFITELEDTISTLHNKEKALVFTSGFVANDSSIVALSKIMPDVVFFSDSDNHASIISGISNSKKEKHIYSHNDISHLRNLLEKVDINRPKVIIFESVYSMSGTKAPIAEICDLAKEFGALTYIDEVHTVGLYGKTGAGMAEEDGVSSRIDIIQGTLGKAFGVIGGYIAGKTNLIDAVRLSASGFIFTTSLPPSITAAANASIKHLMQSQAEREAHQNRVAAVKQAFLAAGIPYEKNESHIIPIIIGDAKKAGAISSKLLLEHGIYVQHINFPTVLRGTERLRITPTPFHNDQMIAQLVNALKKVFQEFGVTGYNTDAA